MGMVGLRDVFVVAPSYHHHHHQDVTMSASNAGDADTALGVGVGVGLIPLLTATPQNTEGSDINFLCNNSRSNKLASGIQLWQNQSPQTQQYLHFKNQNATSHLIQGGAGIGIAGSVTGVLGSCSGSGGSVSGTTTCQDCGNQAKKECSYKRCRTCCKSRGFDCPTHLKSTWIPAARRRERQLMAVAAAVTGTGGPGSSTSTSGTKKPRLEATHQQQTTSHTSTSNTTPPRSFDTSSSHQDAGTREGWPGQIRAPAVFKCVRVTSLEEGEEEYAYQAVVKIGGHVFKGFLYDQGVEPKDRLPNLSELHLGGGGGRNNNSNNNNNDNSNNNNGASSSSPVLRTADVYGGSGGGGLLGGLAYGNQMS